jgi:FAD/FMN-containing dehydrogenase
MSARPVKAPVRDYSRRVDRLRTDYAALDASAPVRLAKKTSNLFRPRDAAAQGLDVSGFSGLITVNRAERTADVLGMTTYEDLVDATLPHGFMPLVVPQLRTITLGGAVTGLGIESTSYRNGCPHESVLEMDIFTGDGAVVTATADNEHRDLFYGFPNSYGSLGYALRLRIELEPVRPFVELQHERHDDLTAYIARLTEVSISGMKDGVPVDFVDGVVFGRHEMYLVTGRFVDEAPYVSDYTGSRLYYRSIQERTVDYLTTYDYLWRWDTDWFWCSAALGVQNPTVRRLVPKRYLRSDSYWKVVHFARSRGITDRLNDLRHQPRSEPIVQDVEIPSGNTVEFLNYFIDEIGISPIWLCPLKQRDPQATWELYRLDPQTMYINAGFWSSKALPDGAGDGYWNRQIEAKVSELGGRKSLYSTAYYSPDEFWQLYNGPVYDVLKKTYDPDGRFPNLYDKTVGRR